MTDAFSSYHPAVNFCYFTLLLGFTMFVLHPFCLVLSLAGALGYAGRLLGGRAVGKRLLLLSPLLVVTALLNPIFNHRGVTILAYLPWGNPLTLESIWYGVAVAALFAAVVFWFTCYHQVMTSDKFIYLFGRVIPALSLVLSMALRFVPRFKQRLERVRLAQRAMGREESGTLKVRLHRAMTTLSVLTTWSMETAVVTADSMKCRGYGLPGRTSFAPFYLDRRDQLALGALALCALCLVTGVAMGGMTWRYVPTLGGPLHGPYFIGLMAVYALLCSAPILIDCWEGRKWSRLSSEI